MKPGHIVWLNGDFSMTMVSVTRIFFRTYLTGRQCMPHTDDRPDFGNDISLQNHEIEKLAIFIYYDTVHNEPNTLI
jgi:hypothetical protein